jgi:hypothetical protein
MAGTATPAFVVGAALLRSSLTSSLLLHLLLLLLTGCRIHKSRMKVSPRA